MDVFLPPTVPALSNTHLYATIPSAFHSRETFHSSSSKSAHFFKSPRNSETEWAADRDILAVAKRVLRSS